MKLNKKGFTLIELLGVVLVLAILLGIAVVAVNKSIQRSKDKTFKVLLSSLEDGALQAYTECIVNGSRDFCQTHKLSSNPSTTQVITITLGDLVNNGYIDDFKNPYNTSETCDLTASYIKIGNKNNTEIGNQDDNQNTKLYDYLTSVSEDYGYKSCLICGSKRSDGCN